MAVTVIRRTITVAASLYAVSCLVLFSLPLFRPESLKKADPLLRLLQAVVSPALDFFSDLFAFNATFMNFNFFLPGIALATWLVQLFVSGRLEWLSNRIHKPLREAKDASKNQFKSAAVVPQGTRMSLLRDYAASKQLLSKDKKDLAFLSIDVVGSTKMKVGEDQISIEHAFSEYKKFLERIFRDCHLWKVAWTPDGVMCCFYTADDAAACGRKVLTELDWFNDGVHHLRTPFSVRCGMNVGEVMFPEDKPLELVSDEVIDIAGHMQKYAAPDALWISGDAFKRLKDQSGFVYIDNKVDNRDVHVWTHAPKKTGAEAPS